MKTKMLSLVSLFLFAATALFAQAKKGYVYLHDITPKPQLRPGENHFLEDERVRKQLGK